MWLSFAMPDMQPCQTWQGEWAGRTLLAHKRACVQVDCHLRLGLPVIVLSQLGSCCHNILQALLVRSAGHTLMLLSDFKVSSRPNRLHRAVTYPMQDQWNMKCTGINKHKCHCEFALRLVTLQVVPGLISQREVVGLLETFRVQELSYVQFLEVLCHCALLLGRWVARQLSGGWVNLTEVKASQRCPALP